MTSTILWAIARYRPLATEIDARRVVFYMGYIGDVISL